MYHTLASRKKELIKYKAKNGAKLKGKTGAEEEEGAFSKELFNEFIGNEARSRTYPLEG